MAFRGNLVVTTGKAGILIIFDVYFAFCGAIFSKPCFYFP